MGLVCLTQDGKGVLKTAFVMEMVSVEGHNTRLGISFSQSCEGVCDVEDEGEREEEGGEVEEREAHNKTCGVPHDGEFKFQR